MIAIGVPAEGVDEPRIGLTPETVKKLVKAGAAVTVRSGAGLRSHFPDSDYAAAGATIAKSDADAVSGADVVLTVRRPTRSELSQLSAAVRISACLAAFSSTPSRPNTSMNADVQASPPVRRTSSPSTVNSTLRALSVPAA